MNPQYGTTLANAATSSANFGGSPSMGQGNDAQIQNLQNLAQIQFRAGNAGNTMGVFGGAASNAADIEEAKRKAAEAAAEAAMKIRHMKEKVAEEESAALLDPKNFVRTVSDDGGYNYFAPDGTPITVQQYSQATGKQIDKALEGSNNPKDAKFITDYKTLLTYGKAISGDNDSVKKFTDSDEGKLFLSNPNNKNKTYAEVVSAFKNHYGSYMQPNQTNNLPAKDNTGRDVRSDIVGGTQAGWLSDWLKGRRNNVTYRG